MPKLPDIELTVRAEDGEAHKVKTDCWVLGDGTFKAGIPAELVAIAYESIGGYGVGLELTATRTVVSSRTRDELIRFLRFCAKSFVDATATTELVIRYIFTPAVAFWLKKDGSVCQNGVASGPSGGAWWRAKTKGAPELHATSREAVFSIGLAAGVFEKITTTRASGKTVRYVHITGRNANPNIEQLNGWTGLSVTDWATRRDVQELPYSDELAQFLHNTILGLCKVARRFDDFFSSPESVALAASKGQLLLS